MTCLAFLLFGVRAGRTAMAAFAVTSLLFVMMYLPFVPVSKRFFPISTLAGIAGAITPLLV